MADRRHALVIATSKYKDPSLRKLVAPGFDARALAKVLRDEERGGFQLELLLDKDSHVVEQGVEEFFGRLLPEDMAVLYFSGHGVKDDAGNLYLAARNTTRQLLRSTGIADGFLRDVMKACRARTQVLILDCCFGGAFAKGFLAKADDRVEVNERFQGQGRVILTASTAMEFAFEEDTPASEERLSVFTRTLVAGLKSGDADADGDGQVSVQDLYDYAFKRIAATGAKQTPTISAVGQEGTIYLANVPESVRKDRMARVYVTPGLASERLGLRPWTQIRDQGNEGANAAVAAVTALETFLARNGRSVSLSARYVYQKAKQLAKQKPNEDNGMEMTTLRRVLEEYGAPLEEDWPYVPGRSTLPSKMTWADLDKRARNFRARLIPTTTGPDIRHHLASNRPVLAQFTLYESWLAESTSRTGVVPTPAKKEQLVGSIATTIVDYDQERKVLHFAHTWGKGWGQAGFGEMTEATAKAVFRGDEMWAVEVPSGQGFWVQPDAAKPARTVDAEPVRDDRVTPAKSKHKKPPRAAAAPPRAVQAAPMEALVATAVTAGERRVFDARRAEGEWGEQRLSTKGLVRGEADPPVGDVAVDATFDAMGVFRTFLQDVFDRSSWDGKGATLEAVVHYGRDFENAFWNGRRIVLGDGGNIFKSFYGLDIVAKELSMGLAHSEVPFVYEGQPGALMQSIGFVFASLVKQYTKKQTAAKANWLIGEDATIGGRALMSLSEPGTAYDTATMGKDPQVGHMSNYVKTSSDSGGVHINCGIPNRAFVLAAKAVGGHAWQTVGRIWYKALCCGKLPNNASFAVFAKQTLRIAKASAKPTAADAIREAWAEVGIPVR